MNRIIETINNWINPPYIASEDVSSKKVVICVEAKSDRSGSLKNISFFEKVTYKDRSDIKIVHKIVRNIEEINAFSKKIKDQNNLIVGLCIRAHANSHILKLSSRTKYSNLNHSKIIPSNVALLKPTFSCLEENAPIILEGCLAGKPKEGYSIAEKISDTASKRVFAANYYLPSLGSKYILNRLGISVTFLGKFYTNDTSWKSKIMKITYHFLFLFGCVRMNITEEIHPKIIS